MSTASIKYPPPAYQYHGESAQKPEITSVQPRAAGIKMVVESDNDAARGGKAERLRGGCIPCPVKCIDSSDCVQLT
jgi:hypothetical protein